MTNTGKARAVVYSIVDDSGQFRKIVIDLLFRSDIGIDKARSTFVHDSIVKGYTFDHAKVERTEIPDPH